MDVAHAINGKRQKRSFWRTHIDRQRQSGCSQTDYCRREGLKLGTFRYWKYRLEKERSMMGVPKLVPIELTDQGTSPRAELSSTVRILVGEMIFETSLTTNPKELKHWLDAFKGGDGDVAG